MHSLGLFTLGLSISFHLCEIKSRHKMLIRVVHRGYSTEDACLIGPLSSYSLAFHLSFRSPLLKTAIWFLAEFGSSSSNWCLVHQPRAFHPLARVCGWLKWWTRRNLAHISPCLPWSYSDWDLIKKLPMSMRPCSSCAMQMQDMLCTQKLDRSRDVVSVARRMFRFAPDISWSEQVTRLSTINHAAWCSLVQQWPGLQDFLQGGLSVAIRPMEWQDCWQHKA